MHKTTIDLSDEHYFFLKERVLEMQKQNRKNATIVSIIRELIEEHKKKYDKKKK